MLRLKRKRVMFLVLVATILAVSASVLAINEINSTKDTYAATMPSSFKDQNFYDCVLAEFQSEFPNETVADTGLTDAQLAKIKTVWCPGSDTIKISDVTGIERMIAVTGITLSENNLTSIDLSQNVNIMTLNVRENQLTSLDISKNTELLRVIANDNAITSLDVSKNIKLQDLMIINNSLEFLDISNNLDLTEFFYVDDILLRANILPITNTVSPSYSLAELNFLTSSQTIEPTADYTYNSNSRTLIVNNYGRANGFVQVASSVQGGTYKLQLPKFVKFDANGGSGAPDAVLCYSDAAVDACSVIVPPIAPTKIGYEFKGYADLASAESANYSLGESINLNEPKTVYAVWNKEDADTGGNDDKNDGIDGGSDGQNAENNEEEDDGMSVPNTASTGKPNTGGNMNQDNNGSGFVLIQGLPVIILGGIMIYRRYFGKNKRRKFEF